MSDLIEFLRARLDEDEAAARQFDGYDPTRPTDLQKTLGIEPTKPPAWELEPSPEYVTVYIEPARVLAEVDAKRRLLETHEFCNNPYRGGFCEEGCVTLELLALPYASHEDYDESWRP